MRQAAQDYIVGPQVGPLPLEVRNIEVRPAFVLSPGSWVLGSGSDLNLLGFQVARSLGILDEVNKMKVLPGASPNTSLPNKNVRYMEVGGSFGEGSGFVDPIARL